MKYLVKIFVVVLGMGLCLAFAENAVATPQETLWETQAQETSLTKVENLKANDAYGFGITVVAMGAVFFGLLCLYLVFKLSDKIALTLSKNRVMKVAGYTKEEASSLATESGEVFAAIAMALEEISGEDHDDENMVLTMKNVARSYSPWSSKIYTLRELPRR